MAVERLQCGHFHSWCVVGSASVKLAGVALVWVFLSGSITVFLVLPGGVDMLARALLLAVMLAWMLLLIGMLARALA